MGRAARFRSTSGGSFCEINNSSSNNSSNMNNISHDGSSKNLRKVSIDTTATATRSTVFAVAPATNDASSDAARRLMEIILQMRDSRGRGLLHQVTDDTGSLLGAADALLTRVQETNLVHHFLTQTDCESGYTPMHWAILRGSLPVILLLLRFPHERFGERPMQLLSSSEHLAKDWEGLTPFRLLSQLQVKTLKNIRQVACLSHRPTIRHSAVSIGGGRARASSFSVHDNDDHDEPENENDFSVLHQGLGLLQLNENDGRNIADATLAGCEVMTFGAAHHAALGVSDTTKNAHHTNRPRRVTFDETRRRTNHAVQVAAAAHHTLVLTKQGHIYACGLGKGGRLGTSGREQSTPIPLRVRGSLAKRHVLFIAAAENHSLCVTKEGGHVYSWGSNRFGQLDGCLTGSSSGSGGSNASSFRCLPQRVVDLKKPCVAVAAGEHHSVALTRHGEVYTWGNNAAGQLGRNSYNRKNGIDRVEALWSCERVAIQVAASEQSTLILIAPSPRRGLPVNSVYSWGHGNPVPIKVTFKVSEIKSSSLSTTSSSSNNNSYHHSHNSLQQVNPIDIACAKHHNVAATEDGMVYTWGLHAEPLASKQSSSLVVASPVTAMLPENGGGLAVAVSASENVTAVVTSEGHLYTWGATNGKDVMGHEGLRFIKKPTRVPSCHRAVGVAVAKEHTVLLIGASYPAVPPVVSDSNLESLAAREVCHHVDVFNVIPICIMAERSHSRLLQDYCQQFIRENLDVVLTFGRKSEMDAYLNEQLADSQVKQYRDADVHPLVMEVVMAGKSNPQWLSGCQGILDNLPVSTLVRYQRHQKRRVSSFHKSHEEHQPQNALQTGFQGCSGRCLMLTANLGSLKTESDIKAKFECLSKEMRGIRKRLIQTNKLQTKDSFTSEERGKLNRKPLLEADLAQLAPALEKVEKLMLERNLDIRMSTTTSVVKEDKKDSSPEETVEAAAFYCDVCDISCPDSNHLEIHTNGRKHRNRMKQVEQEERAQTAASIVLQNQHKEFLAGATPSPAAKKKASTPWKADAVQPRYQLQPPLVPLGPNVVDQKEQRASSRQAADFRAILAEEAGRNNRPARPSKSSPSERKPTWTAKVPPSPPLLTPGPVAPLQNAPWAKSSVINVSVSATTPTKTPPTGETSVKKRNSSSGMKQSLTLFLNGTAPVKAPSSLAASWCPSPVTRKAVPAMPSPSPNSKSLLEIQQEEEAFVKRQARHAVKEGKWYLERTDRANSFSAIQEAEAEEREMQVLIQEQMQIEAQIAREQQEEKAKQNASVAKKNKKRSGARNRSASHPKINNNKEQNGAGKKNKGNSNNAGNQQPQPRNYSSCNKHDRSQQHPSKQRNQKNFKKQTATVPKHNESDPVLAKPAPAQS